MAQFDVFAQRFARTPRTPYVIALQSDLLSQFNTVVVGPLKRIEGTPRIDRLTPILIVKDENLLFVPMELVTVPVRILGAPVANLAGERNKIIAALDMLYTGV
jgi:toxin CcdB